MRACGPRTLHGDVKRAGRYVIVDDFVDAGETVRAIHTAVVSATHGGSAPALLAVLCYADGQKRAEVELGDGSYAPTLYR